MADVTHMASVQDFVARREITIDAPPDRVWRALTDPALHSRVMFGAEVESDWREGSPITWRGEWQGRSFEDKGTILQLKPGRELKMSHFSPASGDEDEPENYHVVDIELEAEDETTRVTLTQSNNPSQDAADHAAGNWEMMLKNLKQVAEAA